MAEEVLIAETTTGRVLETLDGVSGSIGDGLNNNGVTGRFSLKPYPGLRALVAQPWRVTALVVDGDQVLSANPISDLQRSARAGEVELNGASIYSLLARRPAWRPRPLYPPSSDADLRLSGSLSQIASALVQNALNWGSLPIALPANLPSGTSVRNYLSYELNDTASRLLNIVDDQGGRLDIHIKPRWVNGDHSHFEWELRLGEPLGGPDVPWILDSRSDSVVGVGEAVDGSDIATDVWMAGDGQERARQVGWAENPALIDAGWPALHRIDNSSHSSVTQYPTLVGYAQAAAEEGAEFASRVAYVVKANLEPTMAQWKIGENCYFDVYDDDWIPDGRYAGQIGQWSKKIGGDDVALVLADQLSSAGRSTS